MKLQELVAAPVSLTLETVIDGTKFYSSDNLKKKFVLAFEKSSKVISVLIGSSVNGPEAGLLLSVEVRFSFEASIMALIFSSSILVIRGLNLLILWLTSGALTLSQLKVSVFKNASASAASLGSTGLR